jgi:thioredoxin-like negative regulator of GroEL
MKSFDRLLQRHPKNSQLIFGKALLLQQDGDNKAALTLLEDNPPEEGEIAPILLRARLLQTLAATKPCRCCEKHQEIPGRQAPAPDLCAHAGRTGPDGRRQSEFSTLVQQYPEDDELRYSLALVCLEAKAWDEAKGYLEDLIARESHVDSAHLNLGRIAEERNDPQGALIEYAQVGPGNDYLPAQLRQADILMNNGKTAEAQANWRPSATPNRTTRSSCI